jgi:hypothetical protein
MAKKIHIPASASTVEQVHVVGVETLTKPQPTPKPPQPKEK